MNKYANPYLDLSDKVMSERRRDGLGAVRGVQLGAKLACDLVDEMFRHLENNTDLPITFSFRHPLQDIHFSRSQIHGGRVIFLREGSRESVHGDQLQLSPHLGGGRRHAHWPGRNRRLDRRG